MDEFELLFGEEFFIINSDNLNQVESRFYGYAITEKGLIFDNSNINQLDGTGCYISILKEKNEISIFQDFNGCYGIFLYQNENYFALSNSFIKLVEFLKEEQKLTLNKDYAYTFMSSNFCSTVFKETLIDEIQILPYDHIVKINIDEKKLSFSIIDYNEKTVPVYSKECLEILDKWYSKWINLFESLAKSTPNIQYDLSGGFDTRVMLTLLLNSKIDLSKSNIMAFINERPTFIEDYEISSEIANDFGFELNKNIPKINKYFFENLSTSINLTYYIRGGFGKQMYWKNYKYSEKHFQVSGFGGGIIREFYKDPSVDANIINHSFKAQKYSIESGKATKRMLSKTFSEYFKLKDKELTPPELFNMHYRNTRNRYHFGAQITESYFINNIILSPLIDPLLNKLRINNDENEFEYLLYCLIYLRYCPKLLNYKFEGGRKISDETMEFAKKINKLLPFNKETVISSPQEIQLKEDDENNYLYNNEEKIKINDQYHLIRKTFESNSFKQMFISYFPKEIYEKILNDEKKYAPDSSKSDLNAIIIVMKIINDIIYSQLKLNKTPFDFLNEIYNNPSNFPKKIKKPNIYDARIDFKNFGNKNNEIIALDVSDDNARILKPEWFANSTGIGLQLECTTSPLDLELKCINNGELHIMLKSRNLWNKNNERIYINYKKVTFNSEKIIEDTNLASHDDPLILKRNVNDGEIIKLNIEWEPIKK